MAVLEKIRVKFGLLISIIIALALLSFIIDPTTLQSAFQTMSSKYDVGKIAGKSISYTDYQEEVDRLSKINEVVTGSSASSEEQQKSIRDAAWQSLVDKYLFLKNAKAAGIVVGEEEMVDLTTGENPSPVIAQNYAFADESGNFSPDNLVQFVRSLSSDQTGVYRNYWNYLQNSVYTQQFYSKYGALFTNSDIQNPLMLRRAIEESNVTSDVEYVSVPVGLSSDTTVVVTDKEIRDYYASHKDFFKQNASRDIEYVVFEVVPSEKDIQANLDSVNDLYEEFSTTDNMKSFLTRNSDRALSTYWYKPGELNTISTEVNDFVFAEGTKKGDVSPVITDGRTFYVAKVMDEGRRSDSVYVKHIMLTGENAAETADSLVNVLKAGKTSFSNLAALHSEDQGTQADGELGSIGWMTQSYMISGFESVLDAEVNKPFVLNTIYGTHVVLVTQKTAPVAKKQVAILEKATLASKETYNSFYAQANNFATLASKGYDAYKAASDTLGVYSQPMNITEATSTYGTIDNAKEVTRWAFDAKKGQTSGIITVNNNYFFVTTLKDIHKEGYAPVQDVASSIQATLYYRKVGEKVAADVAEKIKGLNDMESIAEALNTSVNTSTGVSFTTLNSQVLDPAFNGAVAAAPEGKICGPYPGLVAVYVFKVTGRDTGSFYTEDDAKNQRAQMAQYNAQMILPIMEEAAEVKDNRARFF